MRKVTRTLQIGTPVGPVSITATAEAIVSLQFGRRVPAGSQLLAGTEAGLSDGPGAERPAGDNPERLDGPGERRPAGTAPESEKRADEEAVPEERADRLLRQAAAELGEYFAGCRGDFSLPLAPRGTEFQQRVWSELRRIPCGETRTYGEIARAIGEPRACRAVGMANNRNPIAILIPCHRVIGRDGSLTGYAAGLAIKRQLLELERRATTDGTAATTDGTGDFPDRQQPRSDRF